MWMASLASACAGGEGEEFGGGEAAAGAAEGDAAGVFWRSGDQGSCVGIVETTENTENTENTETLVFQG